MKGFNILNKQGFLTPEDRKKPLEHRCELFTFKSCIDLSEPVIVTCSVKYDEFPMELYSRDLAEFMCWWMNNVWEDINGFYGFHNTKFVFEKR